jgi:AcrR family transcriptional regulator
MTEKPTKHKPSMRREPTQERAQQTINTIFQATAQIVQDEGEQALNTNKIAAKAGFSIGTLYQYFKSKDSIVESMIAAQRAWVIQRLADLLTRAERTQQPPREMVAAFIHELVQAVGSGSADAAAQPTTQRKTRRAMIRLAWKRDDGMAISAGLRAVSERISLYLARASTASGGALRLRSSPATLFVVTRAVMGVIRSASIEDSPLLGSPEFEEELVRLAWAMLVEA